MVSRRRDNDTSMETILNYDNRDAQSQWSTVWSTTFIPGMDNATGANRFRNAGRRRLRVGSLALSALLTMHSPVPTSAITGGYIVFMMTLSAAVTVLANPMRHFEVYLGQWSMSGPGRAFRIVPLFDGIGIAMCLNAIFRAINYCAVAAIAAMYVVRSVRDDRLPFTYCRDFDLKPYDPEVKEVRFLAVHGIRILMETEADKANSSTIDLLNKLWSNASKPQSRWQPQIGRSTTIELCKERYPGPYPALYATPAFNYFYVEVVKVRPDLSMHHFNMHLMIIVLGVWIIIWFTMLSERWIYKRLIWNNMPQWIIIIPWIWTILLVFIGFCNMSGNKNIGKAFKFGKKTILDGLSDALEIALYMHSASVGTELITGKGLNRYAAGHIDPLFNRENLWHSFLVVLLTGLHSGGALLCAAVDSKHPTWTDIDEMRQSSLWIFPVYSKCTSLGNYSHFMSACIFFGLTFSYITVAYVFMKTAVHIIFEYKVKLVFREQVVVGALILPCALLSMLFTTYGGLPLMESVGAVLTGVATPLICLLELVALLYVYSSHDFTSDMNVAMEDSTCSSRLSIQMQIIPFFALTRRGEAAHELRSRWLQSPPPRLRLAGEAGQQAEACGLLAALISKIVMLIDTELPKNCMILATVPLVCVVIALPLRAVHNTYTYLYPTAAARNG